MPLRIYSRGRLDQRVQFQHRVAAAPTPLGTAQGAWVAWGQPVWAAVSPLRGDERNAAQANIKAALMTIVIAASPSRSAEAIKAQAKAEALRLQWRGQVLEIVDALRIDGGPDWVEIYAKEAGTTA